MPAAVARRAQRAGSTHFYALTARTHPRSMPLSTSEAIASPDMPIARGKPIGRSTMRTGVDTATPYPPAARATPDSYQTDRVNPALDKPRTRV
jgi:hypothetical protein